MMKLDFHKTAVLAKPCPFCGSRKVVTETKEHFETTNRSCTFIECLNCGAQLFGEVISKDDSYETTYNNAQRTVLKMWNRRAS